MIQLKKHKNEKEGIFCHECGKELTFQMGEPYIGNDGYPYCPDCAKRLEEEEASHKTKEEEQLPLPQIENYPSLVAYYIAMARYKKGATLHIKEDARPVLRIAGIMERLEGPVVTKEDMVSFLTENTQLDLQSLDKDKKALDFAVTVEGTRLRGNAYKDFRGLNLAFRLLIMETREFKALGIPEILKKFAMRQSGIVLITGPTGSGKTTTLTCMIDYINQHRHSHIIMLEDPIEYLHSDRQCMITQREVGTDTPTFEDAIVEAMREDPDIIMVGEMRDKQSIEAALMAAETGHLVLSTLHTKGAVNTVTRIIDAFPADMQDQIRTQLSMSLLAVVSQQLPPGIERGVCHLATEVMVANDAIKSMIKQNKVHLMTSTIQISKKEGMYTMATSLEQLKNQGKISEEICEQYQI